MSNSKIELKFLITETIKSNPGIKSVELITRYPEWVFKEFDSKSLLDIIEELIKSKEIIELEYCTSTSNKIKSIYFPKNTNININ